MRVIFWLFACAVFLPLFGFAVKNTDPVVVRYFLGLEWHAPLVIVLLVFFGIGAAIGVLANLAIIARQRREILGLKRDLRGQARGAAAPATAEAI